jgi:hypothetical protein
MCGDDELLEADPRLANEAPRRLLDVYQKLRAHDGDVGFRGKERRAWERADTAVRADLEQLVAAADDTPAQSDPDELEDMASAMKSRAPGLESGAVLGTLLDVLRARVDPARGVRTRFVGASANGIDWDHAAKVLSAWHASLDYSDGDGDEEYLPSVAEALVELWGRVAEKKSAKAVRATGPARDYDPRASYAVGDAIAHPRFGEGVVVNITDALAVVRFASGERKLAHAPTSMARLASVAQPEARRATPATPAVVVRRLPPDPRLREPDGQEQFTHLARPDDDDDTP